MSTSQNLSQAKKPRTAHFTREAHEAQSGLPTGSVWIRYSCHQWNDVLQRRVAVYACYRNTDRSSSVGTFFANALERFKN
jgi:hypothetical protein